MALLEGRADAPYKVGIIAYNTGFLRPVLQELSQRDCLVRQYTHTDDANLNWTQVVELLKWSDCAFFDFCDFMLPMASHVWTDARIVARCHGTEIYNQILKAVDWNKVHLVCSPPQALRFEREVRIKPASITHVNVGVNVEPTKHPKEYFGHNIGLVAITTLPRKRIFTTIESFIDLLLQSKQTWTLHIRTGLTGWREKEAQEYQRYITEFCTVIERMNLPFDQIVFHEYMEKGKYEEWLKGLDVFISNAMQEGYGVANFEAASYGVYPLIFRWLGADLLWPEDRLFLTQRELVDKIMTWDQMSVEQKRLRSLQLQKFVRENHDEKKGAKQVVDVIMDVKQ